MKIKHYLLFLVSTFSFSCQDIPEVNTPSDIKTLESEELATAMFYKVFDAASTLDWQRDMQRVPDSVFNYSVVFQPELNINDSEELATFGKTEHYLSNDLSKKLFVLDSLAEDGEPTYPHVYNCGTLKTGDEITFFTLQDIESDWNCNLYFFIGNRMIQAINSTSQSGLSYHTFHDTSGALYFYYENDFGSGNGSWWKQYFFYKIDQSGLHPVLQIPSDVNYGIPTPGIRYINNTTTLIDTANLTFEIRFSSSLNDGDSTVSLLNDSVEISMTTLLHILNNETANSTFTKEKYLALSHFYFSNNAERLFLHANRKELLHLYIYSNQNIRKKLRSYFYRTLFVKNESELVS